ncbi:MULTISPECIES: putative urea ABC transporter substrate-binding protein [Dickeya]|uniref:Urea carboxylase-related ABC transporter, periplasmic substrate-binding protein n=1 Tax=Dickeya aquatica TaxID=1401087 RepID=A0A375AG82_9GAMM|nr:MULTISPECIES: putative urea ABC transporter substrate-binding protein [Dickeya]SLM65104.1 Urea carboxylase-related ABC transporter, periplasmic substrate-binding protein [Dickeya aquatica]
MKTLQRVLLLCALALCSLGVQAEGKPAFKLCWSIYAGWMPWDYAQQQGIIKKWADKYGIAIQFVQVNDYIESVNQYTAGGFDGCAMTNMDALTIPAAGGVDSTALIVGDYSNGNDGILIKGTNSLTALKGKPINLVQLSVSHYLLARALEKNGMSEKDIKVVNTADADLVAAFGTPDVQAIVTWNPLLAAAKKQPGSQLAFSSAQIPGEILDLLVVNTATLQKHPELGKALTGAWYETLQAMSGDSASARQARTAMGQAAGTDLPGFDEQLAATHLFDTPQLALSFVENAQLKTTMQSVAEFSFRHGLLGDNAPGANVVGVSTPSGVWGNTGNIKLRFSDEFLKLAADHKL